jgi:AmiR/NasT family two-component response regulator
VSVPLEVGDELVGVLNVYIGEAPWPARLRADVELLAVTVAGVLFELGVKRELRQVLSDLEQALTSRATIDQAKGMVMADRGVGPEEAFEHLVRLSSTQQVKVRDLAEEMVRRAASGR